MRFLGAVAVVYVSLSVQSSAAVHDQAHERDCQGIPCDHLPPPGQCRAWVPTLPLEQQPPPGDCGYLERIVPPHARIIYGQWR
jgi:hypothetical protein